MATEYVRYCKNCGLVFKPDPRQHKEPETYCPKCGHKLVKDSDDG